MIFSSSEYWSGTSSQPYFGHICIVWLFCWFHGSSFKGFSIVFLLPDWLKLNHLKSRMERGFSDNFSLHLCSIVAKTIGLTNYAASFGAKNVQETTFEAAEMILGPWNQQIANCTENAQKDLELTLIFHDCSMLLPRSFCFSLFQQQFFVF